ncbi:VWA domain-containing protein [Actinoplanes sp. LDG1-06]|uniref:VWA domain-containing protein n=1 Tax=Paractinoplanes ovalisporus TaxID=2810368 RepID=A0ABS2AV23_9ACTN|nr:VWA domain-containing protein [Actinoplanes ovalisporus]MBM2623213.1 VWA domain-containing protein [Actinoplanes ovalisporus]
MAYLRSRAKPATPLPQSAYRVLPCYLAVDISASMSGTSIAQVNQEMLQLREKMLREPSWSEVCHLSVVVFDETAAVHTPLTDITRITLPSLRAEGDGTDYAPAFELLRHTIAADLYQLYLEGRRPYRPVVFFLSDGQHNRRNDWRRPLQRLTDRVAFHGAPHMLAFGFGEVTAATIQEVGLDGAFLPSEGTPAAKFDTFMDFVLNSLTTSVAAGRPDSDDIFERPSSAPEGWQDFTRSEPTGWREVRIPR